MENSEGRKATYVDLTLLRGRLLAETTDLEEVTPIENFDVHPERLVNRIHPHIFTRKRPNNIREFYRIVGRTGILEAMKAATAILNRFPDGKIPMGFIPD